MGVVDAQPERLEGIEVGVRAADYLHTRIVMDLRRLFKSPAGKEPLVSIGDPRLDGWETVATFEDTKTAVAWRNRLRELGVDAACTADHELDRTGRGDIYLVVPRDQWSRANELVDNV
jgi:hypothetical protein